MGGRGQAGTGSSFSACSAWERLQWEEEAEEHQRRLRHGDYMRKKKTKTSSEAHSAHRTYPVGENSGAPHSESRPKPKSDLKNKRLTPTILMTLRSLDKSKLNARPRPCFRRLLSEGAWLCHRWPPGRLDLVLIQASTYQER